MNILVVEDDPAVRTLVRKTLRAHGHRVLEAVSGPTALQVWGLHRAEIDILLTDIVMPDGMDGLELARRLRSEKLTLRVLYTSGYNTEMAEGRFTGREGIDFLPKPYTPADLMSVISSASTEPGKQSSL